MPTYLVEVICNCGNRYRLHALAANPMAAMIDTLVILQIDTLESVSGIMIFPL